MATKVDREVGDAPVVGLVAHVSGPTAAGWRIIDVWESEEEYHRFEVDRLNPARQVAHAVEQHRLTGLLNPIRSQASTGWLGATDSDPERKCSSDEVSSWDPRWIALEDRPHPTSFCDLMQPFACLCLWSRAGIGVTGEPISRSASTLSRTKTRPHPISSSSTCPLKRRISNPKRRKTTTPTPTPSEINVS